MRELETLGVINPRSYIYSRVRLKLTKRGSCKSGGFYSRKIIFGLVRYFYMINCLTLERMSNSESHISNPICMITEEKSYSAENS